MNRDFCEAAEPLISSNGLGGGSRQKKTVACIYEHPGARDGRTVGAAAERRPEAPRAACFPA